MFQSALSFQATLLSQVQGITHHFGTMHAGAFSYDWANHFGMDRDKMILPLEEKNAGGNCLVVSKKTDERPITNGIVTDQNLCLAIYAADCPPILFSEPNSKVIGALHASWYVLADNGIKNIVSAFDKFGIQSSDIVCAVGPCISKESYIVRKDDYFFNELSNKNPEALGFFMNSGDITTFDIRQYAHSLLKAEGINNIEHVSFDTLSTEDASGHIFHSFRRRKLENNQQNNLHNGSLIMKC
jgi:YfiH family protein